MFKLVDLCHRNILCKNLFIVWSYLLDSLGLLIRINDVDCQMITSGLILLSNSVIDRYYYIGKNLSNWFVIKNQECIHLCRS